MKFLTPSLYHVQTWKNGKGVTHEIARDPNEPYVWRVSCATLTESGPFSKFDGYHRHLALLKGGPLELAHEDGTNAIVSGDQIYDFPGSLGTKSHLKAPGIDFNVFTLIGKATAKVQSQRLEQNKALPWFCSAKEGLLYCAHGTIEITDEEDTVLGILHANDTVWLSNTTVEPTPAIIIRAKSSLSRILRIEIDIH